MFSVTYTHIPTLESILVAGGQLITQKQAWQACLKACCVSLSALQQSTAA